MHIKLSKKNKKNKKITQNGSGDVNNGRLVYNSTNSTNPDPIINNELYSTVSRPEEQTRVTLENTHQTLNQVRKEAGMIRRINRTNSSRKAFKVKKKGGSRVNQKRVTKRSTYRRVNNKKRTHKRK
jgi:hypothetical protein